MQMKLGRFHIVRMSIVLALHSLLISSAVAETAKGKKTMPSPSKIAAESSVETKPGFPLFYKSLVPFSKKEHAQLAFPELPPKYAFAVDANVIPLLITEVGLAEANYPIVLMNLGADGGLTLAILVGLDGKNRYVSADGSWKKDAYVPAWVRRYPFFAVQVEGKSEPMLAVDATYEFLNSKGGKPFFDKDGNATDRLENVLNFNVVYQRDARNTQIALDALKQSGVLETATMQRRLAKEGDTKSFTGFMVVNEKKLMELSDDQIIKLQRSGALGLAYAQMLSMRNIKNLID